MPASDASIVLGSRSPRRRELLALLVEASRLAVRPPLDPDEPSLDEVRDIDELADRLRSIAAGKNDDVTRQLQTEGTLPAVAGILTADTVIVGTTDGGRAVVLGQPPAGPHWPEVVREWFQQYYFGRTHRAMTALCLSTPDGQCLEQVVTTTIHFREDARNWLEWYLTTDEPIGKAGGYALQGAGSLFVDRIDGSPSNVIGLPLQETAELLRQLGLASPG